MTIFQTPDSISVSLEFGVGDIRLVADGLGETVVEVPRRLMKYLPPEEQQHGEGHG